LKTGFFVNLARYSSSSASQTESLSKTLSVEASCRGLRFFLTVGVVFLAYEYF